MKTKTNNKTENFTKTVFETLHLEWSDKAQARELLTQILDKGENVDSILEDAVFAMTEFMNKFRRSCGILSPKEGKTEVYVTKTNGSSFLMVGCHDQSDVAFMVKDCGNYYRFEKQKQSREIQVLLMPKMEDLKEGILLWFKDFYILIEENSGENE